MLKFDIFDNIFFHKLYFDDFSATIFLGEIFELKAELNNEKKEKKKEAVKKVIASMTVGKDVRSVYWVLF